MFHPDYTPLPNEVTFSYNGNVMPLSANAEEAACFYAKILKQTEFTEKKKFNKNFLED